MEPEKRRAQILDSACKVFAEKDYHAASVSEIIDRAQIARGTFYLYFHNKRQIFTEVIQKIMLEIDDRLVDLDIDGAQQDVVSQIRENIRRVFAFFQERPELARIILTQAPGLDQESDELLDQAHDLLAQAIRWNLEKGQKHNILRDFNLELTSYMVLGSMKELLYQYIITKRLAQSLDALVDEVMRYNAHGILRGQYGLPGE